jgi:ribosomal protein L37E
MNMIFNGICPRCGNNKLYRVRRDKVMCSACRYEWKPDRLPLRLRTEQWEAIIRHFINNNSSNYISTETHIERRRVLRALMVLRRELKTSVNDILSRHTEAVLEGVSRSFPLANTRRRPLYILIGRDNLVYATALSAEGKSDLIRKLKKEPVSLSIACWTPADESAAGYAYEACQVDAKVQDELLSSFWRYLEENLVGRGGIRYNRLPLYLAEYAWKFNHRKLSRERKLQRLINLLSG